MDRRTFLRGAAALTGLAVAGPLAAGCSNPSGPIRPPGPSNGSSPAGVHDVNGLPVADWVVAENARPGTRKWVIPAASPNPSGIEGYADRVSVVRGEELGVYVNTTSARFRAEVYRMGYYQGHGARLVAAVAARPGRVQAASTLTPVTNMVECHWARSLGLDVDDRYPPGNYLIKLIGSGGELRYVPFTVRDDSSTAAIVIQNSVTTWQAYNRWGGYSLYGGADGSYTTRARVVSFDRPYGHPPLDAFGSGDWLGNEYPLLFLVERHGLDVTYWTDIDLHAHPERLLDHRCLISLGHDEYWSAAMRQGALDARDRGVNLAFLGANACYRHIRLAPSPLGVDRHQICYKDAGEDPISRTDPAASTQDWANSPDPRPESELIGSMYQSFQNPPVRTPLVVTDASSWVYAGTGARNGSSVPGVVGSEFDAFEPALSGPRNVEILAHSPTPNALGQSVFADMTYYAQPGGGGVFDSGTANWVTLLWNAPRRLRRALGFGIGPAEPTVTRVTLNVLRAFSAGPASRAHPSVANWRRFYAANARPTTSQD